MATRRFDDVYVCPSVELRDEKGQAVGRATNVPYIGRLFRYAHRQRTTVFRFLSKDAGVYVSGYRFWEDRTK